ncbi:MAG: amino acid racemase [Nanoarchaeota archaeon]
MIVGTLFIGGLLDFCLNNSQKFILSKLLEFDGTASQFAASAGLPRSTVFSNLRILRKLNIVKFGNSDKIEINPFAKEIFEPRELVIGVVGGFGSETTAEFFSRLIKLSRERLNKRPKVVIANAAPPDKVETAAINGNVEKIFPFAAECIDKLNAANADFIVIPCNTPHIFIDEFRQMSAAPVLSIIEEAVAEMKRKNISSVGILATTATIKSKMFQNEFAKEKIETLLPNNKEQNTIVNAINAILKTGETKASDVKKLKTIIKNMKKRGAQAVLLACTDLQLFVEPDGKVIFDTMEILASAAVARLDNNPAVATQPLSFAKERVSVKSPKKGGGIFQSRKRDHKVACSTQACGIRS